MGFVERSPIPTCPWLQKLFLSVDLGVGAERLIIS